jgi:hypothetical protein
LGCPCGPGCGRRLGACYRGGWDRGLERALHHLEVRSLTRCTRAGDLPQAVAELPVGRRVPELHSSGHTSARKRATSSRRAARRGPDPGATARPCSRGESPRKPPVRRGCGIADGVPMPRRDAFEAGVSAPSPMTAASDHTRASALTTSSPLLVRKREPESVRPARSEFIRRERAAGGCEHARFLAIAAAIPCTAQLPSER